MATLQAYQQTLDELQHQLLLPEESQLLSRASLSLVNSFLVKSKINVPSKAARGFLFCQFSFKNKEAFTEIKHRKFKNRFSYITCN